MNRLNSRLRTDRSGYCFRFKLIGEPPLYGHEAAKACVAALRKMRFTGRCEYYEADDHVTGDLLVGLGLKQAEGPEVPDLDWQHSLVAAVVDECVRVGTLTVDMQQSERCGINGIRHQLLESGDAEFRDGKPVRLIDYDVQQGYSWFAQEVLRME